MIFQLLVKVPGYWAHIQITEMADRWIATAFLADEASRHHA